MAAQQEKLALPTTPAKEVEGQDEEDVDDSFKHLRIAEKGGGKKGKVVRGERGIELEGEAKRAQAIRGAFSLSHRSSLQTGADEIRKMHRS